MVRRHKNAVLSVCSVARFETAVNVGSGSARKEKLWRIHVQKVKDAEEIFHVRLTVYCDYCIIEDREKALFLNETKGTEFEIKRKRGYNHGKR